MRDFDYYKSVEEGRRVAEGRAGVERVKEKPDKKGLIWKTAAGVVIAAYYVLLFGGSYFFDGANSFYRSLNLFSGAGDPNKIVRVVSYLLFFAGIAMGAHLALDRFLMRGAASKKMGGAVVSLISSLIQYACAIAAVLLSLNALGVDAMGIVAGLGVLSLIIGMGAKELISDVLAGLFIIFERSFGVGDIIVVNNFRGEVKVMGIRTTQIEDEGGNVLIVNNSKLGNVINMTEQLSIANVQIGIAYTESLEKVEGILKEALPEIGKEIPELKEGPFYEGITEINWKTGEISLAFIASCEEGAKYRVERALLRRLKILFDEKDVLTVFSLMYRVYNRK